ncbi:MAG: cytochrome c oxidase accessory protein CcoG [Phycisphaerales bacterium]
MPDPSLLQPNERVLATLNADGSRRWLRPRVSKGNFLTARRAVAYALIAIFTLIPYITINGKPAVLLDITSREFTVLGFTFLPTDTVLLAFFMMSVFVTIVLLTALFGRVWCGWACPQTVYMEFLFRPIERLIEGAPSKKQAVSAATGARKALKHAVYLLCSLFLAHTFLAYFVGVDQLRVWVTRSPFEHPTSFLVMAAVTALMMFDFGFFREQVCLVACPYGRFQGAMLDRNSLTVTYDRARGEPRGKLKRKEPGDVSLAVVGNGDCIDCQKCVTTCPTGIDIRDGLQMECIGCAQCIDACNDVMKRIGKPAGLIRYSSQAAIEGQKFSLLRPRIVLYPLLLAGFVSAFFITLATKADADVTLMRARGVPFVQRADGMIQNTLRIRITNRTAAPQSYTFAAEGLDGLALTLAEGVSVTIAPGESETVDLRAVFPPASWTGEPTPIRITVTDGDANAIATKAFKVLGPHNGTGSAP